LALQTIREAQHFFLLCPRDVANFVEDGFYPLAGRCTHLIATAVRNGAVFKHPLVCLSSCRRSAQKSRISASPLEGRQLNASGAVSVLSEGQDAGPRV